MASGFLPEITFRQLLQIVLLLAGAVAYAFLSADQFSDNSGSLSEENRDIPLLSRNAERIRWQWAIAAIVVVLVETAFGPVRSWGVLVELLIVAAAYLSGPRITTRFGGEIDLTPRQQAARRRLAIVPAVLVLIKGTNFQTDWAHATILAFAAMIFALLILVPEPPL